MNSPRDRATTHLLARKHLAEQDVLAAQRHCSTAHKALAAARKHLKHIETMLRDYSVRTPGRVA